MLYQEINACRSCHSPNMNSVLDLGELAISDFVLPGDQEDKAPLELVLCQECSLVQLRHTVAREHLYREYWYRSGVNESMVASLKDVVEDAISRVELEPDDYVLDLGANDGTMLAMYPRWVWCHGFEPAVNLVHVAMKRAHARIFPTFFPPSRPLIDKYKIVTSIAQFYNVDNPDDYVKAVKGILHPDGVWVVQMQGLEDMLDCTGFDNICHEHVTYWSQAALAHLLGRHGMMITNVAHNNTNGGSVRYVVRHANINGWKALDDYRGELREFGKRVERLKGITLDLLEFYKAEGKRVYGMGASTKLNTLAQYYGLGPKLITAIGERSPEKWGRYTVGTHIPIISENELLAENPDYILVGPWHFFDSFRERYSAYKGQWIVPLPELRVVSGGELCPSTVGGACVNA